MKAVAGDYPKLGTETRDAIKGAKLVEVPNAGHIPHIERPDAFDEALITFIAQ